MAQSPKITKNALVRSLLAREDGASIDALCAATGWQAHSVRAVFSTLRKSGAIVERLSKTEAGTTVRYRLQPTDGAAQ